MDPLRSEADAFRVVVIVGAGAASVIFVTLLIGSLAGSLWGLFLICLGAVRIVKALRRDAPTRHISLQLDDVARPELIDQLRETDAEAEYRIAMVIPPGSPAAEHERARQRVEVSVQLLQEAGLRARGEVREADRDVLADPRVGPPPLPSGE